MSTTFPNPKSGGAHDFTATHWSVILAAKEGNTCEVAAALEKLCRTYWYPLYAFLRRQGRPPHDAQDLTQEFFARLLRGKFLENVGMEKGKFRSFLLASLKNFLCDEWDKATARKRGGGHTLISLDEHNPEELYLLEPDTGASAESVFERQWAVKTLEQAMMRLRGEFQESGKTQEFDELKVFLSTLTTGGGYVEVGRRLGIGADSVALKVYRLRQRYGELIRDEIAQTVARPAEIEAELEHLFNAIGRQAQPGKQ